MANQTNEEQRLDRLKEIFSSLPEGCDLLELAERNGCAIFLKHDMPEEVGGRFNIEKRDIHLNGQYEDDLLLNYMAHELRHLWQASVTDYKYMNAFSVPNRFVFLRLIEGDAYAYSAVFSKKLEEKTGIAIPHHNFSDVDPTGKMDMKEIFMNFQRAEDAQDYDQRSLKLLKSFQSHIRRGNLDKKSLKAIFNHASAAPPLDESAVNILVNGLDTSAPKYLDFKTVQELTDAVLAHVPPGTLKKAAHLLAGIRKTSKIQAGL